MYQGSVMVAAVSQNIKRVYIKINQSIESNEHGTLTSTVHKCLYHSNHKPSSILIIWWLV